MKERPEGTKEKILEMLGNWGEPARSRELQVIMDGDRYDECPFKATGFRLVKLSGLGSIILGPDEKCVCTTGSKCLDIDKRDGMRCSLKQLEKLSDEAVMRRAWQSGGDW